MFPKEKSGRGVVAQSYPRADESEASLKENDSVVPEPSKDGAAENDDRKLSKTCKTRHRLIRGP